MGDLRCLVVDVGKTRNSDISVNEIRVEMDYRCLP